MVDKLHNTSRKKARITQKQKIFADKYLETGNGSRSAREAYNVTTDESARQIASQNFRKPAVIEYFIEKSEDMKHNLYNLARNAESEAVRLNATKDILDRAGFQAVKRTDVTSGGESIAHDRGQVVDALAVLYGDDVRDVEPIEDDAE